MNATSYSVTIITSVSPRGTTRTRHQWAAVLGCRKSDVHGLLVRHCPEGYLVRQGRVSETSLRVHPIECSAATLDRVCVATARGAVTMTRRAWADLLGVETRHVMARLSAVQGATGCGMATVHRPDGADETTVEPTYWMRWRGVEVGS